jgi:RNA polymerase sigma-70 factor (ECF subfamily)
MEEDESALLAAARAGNQAAFERLVARYADSVFRIAAAHVGRDEAEDAAQEVFVRVHQGLRGFQGDSRFSTWIYRIATNVALTRGRRRRRRSAVGPLDSAEEPAARDPSPEEDALREERRSAVRRALAELPEKERAVAVLRALEGLPFEEVADALGIKRPTAESRMARAKERLRAALARWIEGS